MHRNRKMRPFITVSGMEGGEIKDSKRWGELSSDIYYKNFCECHNVCPVQ
jgi:hypothetical protein